jgi:hypothetical protein
MEYREWKLQKTCYRPEIAGGAGDRHLGKIEAGVRGVLYVPTVPTYCTPYLDEYIPRPFSIVAALVEKGGCAASGQPPEASLETAEPMD